MSESTLVTAVNQDCLEWINSKLKGSSSERKVQWDDIIRGATFTRREIIDTLNSILRPKGNVSGMDNLYWIDERVTRAKGAKPKK